MFINRRLLIIGLVVWGTATMLIREVGGAMIPARPVPIIAVFASSFLACGIVAQLLCRWFLPDRDQWPVGGLSLMLPTLLLDPLTSAFFQRLFPGIPIEAAGVFGGWMLCCSAGALMATTVVGGGKA